MLLLGIGIAASTITFSVVSAFWLRPLVAQQPEKLVRLVTIRPRIGARSYFSVGMMEALQKRPEMFRKVGAGHEFMALYEDGVHRERALVGAVSPSYFEVFGVGGDGVWVTRRVDVVGKPVTLKGQRFVVTGKLPEGFHGTGLEAGPEIFVTTAVEDLRTSDDLEIVARLRMGFRLRLLRSRPMRCTEP